MIFNKERIGNFTGSEIFVLAKLSSKGEFLKAALTYIEEKIFERRLGRCIDSESNARPLTWGTLLEQYTFDEKLSTAYSRNSKETMVHPTINYWASSIDAYKYDNERAVAEQKCPMTLKSFVKLVQPLYDGLTGMDAMNAIRENHPDGEKFYWQIVSGACVANVDHGELIVYLPYFKDLPAIRELAQETGESKFSWIYHAEDADLPFLLDDGYYKDLNILRFKVPEEDKKHLTACILKAGKILLGSHIIASSPEPGIILAEPFNPKSLLKKIKE